MADSSRRLAVWMSVMVTVLLLCVGASWAREAEDPGGLRRLDLTSESPIVVFPWFGEQPSLDGVVSALMCGKYHWRSKPDVKFIAHDGSPEAVEEVVKSVDGKTYEVVYLGVSLEGKTKEGEDEEAAVGKVIRDKVYGDEMTQKWKDDLFFYTHSDLINPVHRNKIHVPVEKSFAEECRHRSEDGEPPEETTLINLTRFAEGEGTERVILDNVKDVLMKKFEELFDGNYGNLPKRSVLYFIVAKLEGYLGKNKVLPLFKKGSAVILTKDTLETGYKMLWSGFEEFAGTFFNDGAVDMFKNLEEDAQRKVNKARGFHMFLGGYVDVLYADINVVESTRLVHPIMEDAMEIRIAKFFMAKRKDGDEVIYSVRKKQDHKENSCLDFVNLVKLTCGGGSVVGNSVSGEVRMSKMQDEKFKSFIEDNQKEVNWWNIAGGINPASHDKPPP
eukprot:GHVS01002056.1.p1 GENE.GHVS01002056.1~~GHVS01002056.1.p1  ORF type:complete len:445 (+),score=55.46 GHVS01002056.1:166-1500(+)